LKDRRQHKRKPRRNETVNSRKCKEGESSGTLSSGTIPKKMKVANTEVGLQKQEFRPNECAVCFGLYNEDVDPDSGDITYD